MFPSQRFCLLGFKVHFLPRDLRIEADGKFSCEFLRLCCAPYDWQLITNVTTYLQLEGYFSKLCVRKMTTFASHTKHPVPVLTEAIREGLDQTDD